MKVDTVRLGSPTLHLTVLLSLSLFLAMIILATVFRIEVVARGEGRVVPERRVQTIQPEFSGRIDAIEVRNGSLVEKGDRLLQLDQTEARSALGKIQAEKHRLQIELARIDAMVDVLNGPTKSNMIADAAINAAEAAFDLPVELNTHPFTTQQRELLRAEVNDLVASQAQIDARARANRLSEEVSQANIARIDAALTIQSERLSSSEQLLQQGATSRSAYLDVQQAHTEFERERDVATKQLAQKVAERTAISNERRRLVTDRQRVLLDRRAQLDSRLASLIEEERAASRRVEAATLLAPVAGIVDRLAVFTVGGVAEAGEELLRIVPTEGQIELEAVFTNQDIGFMKVGQRANVRLHAFPSERYGSLKGQISDIAADSIEYTDGQWGYVVRVTPDADYLSAGPEQFTLLPGMTATIDVTTDQRRIISYFFAPIVKTIQNALGER